MKKHLVTGLAFVMMIAASSLAFGAMHGDEHGEMKHDSMKMDGGMIMLGEQSVDGVKAMFHLKDVSKAMEKMKMDKTHHLMVMFTDKETGKGIEEGLVAVKIKSPGGEKGKPIKMMGMQGHFGVDVDLDESGMYHFEIGTKLKDGKKRKFHSHYKVD